MNQTTQKLRNKIENKLHDTIKDIISNNPALLINEDEENIERIINKAMWRLVESNDLHEAIADLNEEIIQKHDFEHVRELTNADKHAIELIMQAHTNNEIAQLAWNELHEMYTGTSRLRSMYDNGIFKTIKTRFPSCGLWNGEFVSHGEPIPLQTLKETLIIAIRERKLHW